MFNVKPQLDTGFYPSLKLYSEDGKLAESLSIDNWKTEEIVAFLQDHLSPEK